jgi:hypothetical protein
MAAVIGSLGEPKLVWAIANWAGSNKARSIIVLDWLIINLIIIIKFNVDKNIHNIHNNLLFNLFYFSMLLSNILHLHYFNTIGLSDTKSF